MACRSCSTGLGQLPRRLAAPLRHGSLESAAYRASLVCTSTSSSASTSTATRIHSAARRTLHTTAPREKLNLKEKLLGRIAQSLATNKSNYFIYKATETLYKDCAARADYSIDPADRKHGRLQTTPDGEEIGVSKGGAWHNDLGLLPTFSTWAHVTMLHMYLIVVRYRCFEPAAQQAWQTALVNHFFYQAEAKMEDAHDLTSRMIRQRYLKDLFVQWRGVILAYDEGIVKGDAVLASAVWRNLFKAREDVDVRAVAAVVAWMRAGLAELGGMPDEVVERGSGTMFPSLGHQFRAVDVPTASLKPAFAAAGVPS